MDLYSFGPTPTQSMKLLHPESLEGIRGVSITGTTPLNVSVDSWSSEKSYRSVCI